MQDEGRSETGGVVRVLGYGRVNIFRGGVELVCFAMGANMWELSLVGVVSERGHHSPLISLIRPTVFVFMFEFLAQPLYCFSIYFNKFTCKLCLFLTCNECTVPKLFFEITPAWSEGTENQSSETEDIKC